MRPRRPWLAAALALAACAREDAGPMARIVSAAPTGSVAPDAVEVSLAFDAPVDRTGLEDGRYFALCRREDLREVSHLAESEAGLAAGAPTVAARAALSADGVALRLTPAAPLAPGAKWAAVLSARVRSASGRPVLDPDGHAGTFALLFETGAAPDREPPRARWVLPPHGPAPANLAALALAFDEPVQGALALAGTPSRAEAISPDVLGLALDAALPPGELALSLDAVQDLAGNAAVAPPVLAVSRCSSDAAPAAGIASATAGELSFALEAPLAGMGRLVAEVSARPGDPACGAAPEPPGSFVTVGDVLPCPGADPCSPGAVSCPGRVEVKGLCPGQPLRARISSEDLAGHRSSPGAWLEVASLPPRPAPVLTEALADADTPEAGGEYVEVANLGTGDADLTGFALAKLGTSGTFTRCTIAPLAGGPIPPGGFALVVGGAYDGRYAVPPGTTLYRCGATALAGGLANDRPVALALEDPVAQVISTMGISEAAPRCATGSLERVHPSGADAADDWACPRTRSPGACNRSTPPEECPKRPW